MLVATLAAVGGEKCGESTAATAAMAPGDGGTAAELASAVSG